MRRPNQQFFASALLFSGSAMTFDDNVMGEACPRRVTTAGGAKWLLPKEKLYGVINIKISDGAPIHCLP